MRAKKKVIKRKKEPVTEEIINPLDFFDLSIEEEPKQSVKKKRVPSTRRPVSEKKKQKRGFFITGTDTDVGKTVSTFVLGTLLQSRNVDVGVMKPVQCGGQDASFLIKSLGVEDPIEDVNPYYSKEALSPHIAFIRKKEKISIGNIINLYNKLKNKHDILLVEGAGGLLVPIKENYLVADLIKEFDLELIIVARLGLGTINHTLLTINQARELGIKVNSVIFCESKRTQHRVPERTNPKVINRLGKVPVLGTIPFIENIDKNSSRAEVLKKCKTQIKLAPILNIQHTDNTKQYSFWDKKYVWHPFTQMQDWNKEAPLVIDEASGCWLKDTSGKKYIDGISSLWVNLHGHRKNVIDRSIKDQINKLSHSTLLGISNTPSVKLAKKLVEISPRGLDKVFYSDNGSTSVEIAIKMAYQYWQNIGKRSKTKIAHLSNSYHGDTLGSVSVGGIDLFHKVYNKLIFKTVKFDFPDFYRTPKGKRYPQYTNECLNNIEKVFKVSHKSIAALVVEPIVQGAAGIIVWPSGVLKKLEELCKKYNVLLIADEVATGFGRTGKMFACEHEQVSPDFLCIAKGLTGGYLPLAATLTSKKIYDGFLFDYKDKKTFFHGHTYTGNPLCCAAALANIKVFEKEQTLHKLQPKIAFLERRLKEFEKLNHVGDIRQKGFMAGIELVKNKRGKVPYKWEDKVGVNVCIEARKKGVLLRPLGNVIVIMPPLSISKQELITLLSAAYSSIEKVTK